MPRCWIHAKRPLAEYGKATVANGMDTTVAIQAVERISEIFHLAHQCGDCTNEERAKHRQLIMKPKVDDFFAWIKDTMPNISAGSNTCKNLQYCNQLGKVPTRLPFQ